MIAEGASPALRRLVPAIEPIGTLWVNAIRMTVVPLVVSLLVTRIASTQSGAAGRLGGRAILWFVILAGAGAAFTALVGPPLIGSLPIDPATIESIRGQATAPAVNLPPFRDWLVNLIPANPVKAAADGALLPVVIFAALLGLALGRLDPTRRRAAVEVFEGIVQAMFVVVGWVIALSPLGVFALGLGLAASGGLGVAAALGLFVVAVSGLLLAVIAGLYLVAALLARVPLGQFARAAAPAQAIGLSTRSSFAALPVMIDRAERALGVRPDVAGLVLPMAASIFKIGTPVARFAGTLFVARLFSVPLGGAEVAALAALFVIISFYTPGVPSGSIFIMAPIYQMFGLPVTGLGILLAVDLIPDMFLTMANVTADLVVVGLLSRSGTPPQHSKP